MGKGITRMEGCTWHSGHLSREPLIPVRSLERVLSKLGLCPPMSHVGPFFSLSLKPLRVRASEEGATKIGAVLDSISCEPLNLVRPRGRPLLEWGWHFASISYESLILLRPFGPRHYQNWDCAWLHLMWAPYSSKARTPRALPTGHFFSLPWNFLPSYLQVCKLICELAEKRMAMGCPSFCDHKTYMGPHTWW